MAKRSAPQIVGVAGTGLVDAGWAANAAVAAQGHRGETRTAEVLNRLVVGTGSVVLHDLRIPIPGFTANIDHAVVCGSRVYLIDSKSWAPAFYWTLAGSTYRGLARFRVARKDGTFAYPAESMTMPMAYETIERYLARAGHRATMARPVVVVWPSSPRPMNLRLLKMPSSKVVPGARFARYAWRMFTDRAADPGIVSSLSTLVNQPGRGSSAGNLVDF